jgi:SAM-dependent methyltransferase
VAFHRDDRLLFDQQAEDYEAARPGYPAAAIAALLAWAQPPRGGRVLEVGCGTGQLTVPLAEAGLAVTAVELGGNLSRIAAAKLSDDRRTTVVHADFEAWEPEPRVYEMAASSQAFHWIRPEIGYPKVHRALRDRGTLALIWNLHPRGESPVERALAEAYRTHAPQMGSRTSGGGLGERVERTTREITVSGLFEAPEVLRFPWSLGYSSEEYVRLLNTFSDHLALPRANRSDLLQAVRDVIDRHGGRIDRAMVCTLFLTRPKR